MVADLEQRLPFRDDAFDEVFSSHVLEHVRDLIPLLGELARICRPGAVLRIEVPHLSFFGAYTDPTHKRFFGYHSFDYFTEEGIRFEDAAANRSVCPTTQAVRTPPPLQP